MAECWVIEGFEPSDQKWRLMRRVLDLADAARQLAVTRHWEENTFGIHAYASYRLRNVTTGEIIPGEAIQ